MTVAILESGVYRGLSTDTKPTAPSGYRFYETDTYDTLVSDGTFWWNTTSYNATSPRRWGAHTWTSNVSTGIASISAISAYTGAGTQSFFSDTTNGRYVALTSLTTVGDRGGYRVNTSAYLITGHNPRLRFKFQMPAATDYTLSRMYFGLASQAEKTGDDALNATNGVMVGFISGGTAFKIFRNDGTGATVASDPAGATQTLNTAVHNVSIVSDIDNSRWGVKWDTNPYDFFTTDIPVSANALTLHCMNETNESGVAKIVRLFQLLLQVER